MRDTRILANASVSPFSQGAYTGIRVTYRGPINPLYDEELKSAFEAEGYIWLANNFDAPTNVRDVYFRKPGD